MADHGSLKGKVFKMKALSPQRVKGLAAFAAVFYGYSNLAAISLMFGSTIPIFGLAAASFYGMNSFAESATVSSIEALENGQVRIQILKSPLFSYTITANIKDIHSVCSLGNDDLGADDCESNIISIKRYQNSAGEYLYDGVFRLPADAFRDK